MSDSHASSIPRSPGADEPGTGCYQCGAPIPPSESWCAVVAGAERTFCCAGCRAVAETIRRAGLDGFYERREAPSLPVAADAEPWERFDEPAVQAGFVRRLEDGRSEVSLLLEGIQCAACVWLNEAHLRRLPGLSEVSINYATRRARVRWDSGRLRLSAILGAVAQIGYRAHPYDPERQEAIARSEARWLLLRAAIAGLAMMQVMMFAVPGYLSSDGVEPEYESLFRWASLVLTVPAVLFSGWPFLAGAVRSVRARTLGMDVPVALGVLVAFAASVHATWTGEGDVYYDSVTMFLALLLTSRYFELRARQRAASLVESLARSVPVVAERLDGYPGSLATTTVPVDALVPGEHVLVAPGATFPADGAVVAGRSHADEALVTGESWPVAKEPGSEVLAGAVNRDSRLVVRVSRAAAASRVGQIIRLVERAMHDRPGFGAAADRVAAWSVAAVLLAAAIAGAWWAFADPAKALPVAVAVLVVSCPCALSLAVPTALAAATTSLARRGILLTRGDALEATARLTDVVFDKTGTLTEGRFALVGVLPLRELDREQCLRLAAALEAGSEHPVAAAVRRAATPVEVAGDVRGVPGAGVEGTVAGTVYRIGNPEWVASLHGEALPLQSRLLASHATPVALADERGWIAWFTFADELRAGATGVVGQLRAAGLRVHLLSGDRPATVAHYAQMLGVDSFHGGLTPEAKLEWLQGRQAGGARMMMVGDGVNDAPVLARADVSVAMASGTPLAMLGSDVVLLGTDIGAVAAAVRGARRAFRVMRQNFGWAILYNALAIPLAAAGAVTPLIAGLGMSLSSLLVVANSLRISARLPSRRPRTGVGPVREAPASAA
jgi:Cu2+-exporting ATPase